MITRLKQIKTGMRMKRRRSNLIPQCICTVVFVGNKYIILRADNEEKTEFALSSPSHLNMFTEIPTLENK